MSVGWYGEDGREFGPCPPEGRGDAGWGDVVARYEGLILRWCRQWGLQEADAQDLCQTVWMKVAPRLRPGDEDPGPRFRAYLKMVAYHAWADQLNSRRRAGLDGEGSSELILATLTCRDDPRGEAEAAHRRELLARAMRLVARRVDPRTWEAFRLQMVEGLSGAEVAGRLDMSLASAFQARSRVRRMLRETVALFELLSS